MPTQSVFACYHSATILDQSCAHSASNRDNNDDDMNDNYLLVTRILSCSTSMTTDRPTSIHPAELDIEGPWTFELINMANPVLKTHAGVLEFTADEGVVYLPSWVSV